MKAYYDATLSPSEISAMDETYNIWRCKNPNKQPSLDANKLKNIRRDIIKNKRLMYAELDVIKIKLIPFRPKHHPPLEKNKPKALVLSDCQLHQREYENLEDHSSPRPHQRNNNQGP